MKKRYVVFLSLVAGAMGLIGVGLGSWQGTLDGKLKAEKDTCLSRAFVRPVPTALACRLSPVRMHTFPGRVRANRDVNLAFSVSGLLKELNATEGRRLRRADVLAKLDQRDFQYAVEMAKAKHSEALRAFERVRSLRDKGALPQAEYDKVEATYSVSKAELRVREKALEDSVLLAPFDGVVAKRYVENYEHVEARQCIVSFQDMSWIEIVIQVPERLIANGGALSLKKIQVRFNADEERWFDAYVHEFRAESDSATGTYDVVVRVTPAADLKVLPGMTAMVRAQTADFERAFERMPEGTLVPAEAIWNGSDGKSFVWIVPPTGGSPLKTEVTVGSLRESGIEIVSGLKPGQHVAVAGVHTLREEMQVRPSRKGKEGLDG